MGEGAEARQQQSRAEGPATRGHGPRLEGGFAQCLGGSDPARPPGGGDDSRESDEQTGPEGRVEGPGGVADGEPAGCEALVHQVRDEHGRPVRPEQAARGGGHHAEQQRLGDHRAADLARGGAGRAQQGELLAALGDREREGGGDDEHRDEAGDAARGAECGVHGEQRLAVALGVGVGVAAVPAGQDPYVGVLTRERPYRVPYGVLHGGRVGGHDELVDGGRDPGGAGVGPEDGVLEAAVGDGADHGYGAVVGADPGPGPGPAGGDDLVVGARGAARVEGVRGEGGDRPGMADQVLRPALGADGEGPVLGGRAEGGQPPGEFGGDGPGVGEPAGALPARNGDAQHVVALDDDGCLGESLREALRGVQRGGESEAHGGDEADAEGQGHEASDEGDPAVARGAQGDGQHGAPSSAVMRAAMSWACAPRSSPFGRPSARKTTRSA